jgi:hypothetical protein
MRSGVPAGGWSGNHEHVVVKLSLGSPDNLEREASVLSQLRQVPNVGQLLDVVNFTPDDRPPRFGLVLPYYDTGGTRLSLPILIFSMVSTPCQCRVVCNAGACAFTSDEVSTMQLSSDLLFAKYTKELLQVRGQPFSIAQKTTFLSICSCYDMSMTQLVMMVLCADANGHPRARSRSQ